MAVGKFRFFNQGREKWGDSSWNLDAGGDTMVCVLLTNSYTPDPTHTAFSSLSAAEVTGGNYARKVLGSQSIEPGTGGAVDEVYWKGNKVAFGTPTTDTTILARYMAMIRKTGTGTGLTAGDLVLGFFNLDTVGTGLQSTNGKYEVRFSGVDGVGTLFTATGADADV